MEPAQQKRPASLLGTLRTAVNKVRFLLNFRATRWILTSIAGRNPRAGAARRLSFGSRRPSLLDAEDDASPPSAGPSRTASLGSATTVSRTSSSAASSEYSRSASSGGESSSSPGGGSSSPAGDEDIDRRAEQFIANFYRHIQMERQVSLQLRYCRVDSLKEDRTPPRLI